MTAVTLTTRAVPSMTVSMRTAIEKKLAAVITNLANEQAAEIGGSDESGQGP